MRSGKLIDISKSSLVSLKAELAKKQEEARLIKESGTYVKLPPRPKPLTKTNAGVDERNRKDLELTSAEVDLLKKSREVLEIKASLYDKLQNGSLVSEDGKERFLVDFGRKSPQPSASEPSKSKENLDLKKFDDQLEKVSEPIPDDDFSETTNYNDGEWVEYTDCLGRTRRCHRTDWDLMKDKDKNLAKTLHKEAAANIISNPNLTEEDLAEKEMLSHDMHLELLRRKWEDKERELMDKDNVHYEDVLFDEARSHGVGYWRFSTDPEKREKEQEMLRKVRAETEQRQKEAKALRDRREQQRQARLIAARQRQRARLGLPPIEIVEDTTPKEETEPDKKEEEVSENLEIKLQKAAHVRPWDVGKDGLKKPLMTQEEWNEKKRSERPKEFAPTYSEDSRQPKRKKFDLRPPSPHPEEEEENPFESRTKNFLKKRKEREEVQKRKGAEIPPPMDFDYHTPNADKVKPRSSYVNPRQTAEAIDAGLRLLREQFEKDQNAVPKGEL